MLDILQFILAGTLVGFCVGVTGVGGGSLMTPILIGLFKIEPHIAIGTDLLYAAISKLCCSVVHAKKLHIVWGIVGWLVLGSIPASFATTWYVNHFLSGSNQYRAVLTVALGFMLTLTGMSIIFRSQIEKFFSRYHRAEVLNRVLNTDEKVDISARKRVLIVFMGAVLGICVTLSSVGAGAFGVMALVIMFPNLPMVRIIGSDVLHAVVLTSVAGFSHAATGNIDWHLLMWLLVGSIPAVIAGTLVGSKLPEKLIRRILGLTLFLLGIGFILK